MKAPLGLMPRLTDKNEIRTLLRRDPAWSVYALGDLAPPMFPKTLWFAPDLTLVVQDYGTAILFAMGPGSVARGPGMRDRARASAGAARRVG